jgi:hypothetical protein
LEQDHADMETFKSQKAQFEEKVLKLENDVATEKKIRLQEGSEKDREKLHATEKLRREMLKQIKQTKASLLALNDDQQHTTTRLTIMQNSQLTHELEYQSKQTESLLASSNKMQQTIDKLNRDISIHKEVEKELAKRSHFC